MTKIKDDGYMTVGEVSKIMGITVRTLQYYDRENILCPSALSEGGRRLYNHKDLIKLHQIISLKSLGFSLEEIKNKIMSLNTPEEIVYVLSEQSKLIQSKIDSLTSCLNDITALKSEVISMQKVDFKKYADIIINLQMKNDAYWLIKYFDDNTLEFLRKRFDKDSGLAMLTKFNSIMDKAISHNENGIMPDSEQGLILAREFWEMITEFTKGDMSLLPKLMEMGNVETDNEEWKNKIIIFNEFMEKALNTYFREKGKNPFKEDK